jgi:uncharacterized membrane protein
VDIDDSRQAVDDQAEYALLVTHIFTAFIALVLGPLQFIPAVRAHRKVHRTIGRVYLLAGVLILIRRRQAHSARSRPFARPDPAR